MTLGTAIRNQKFWGNSFLWIAVLVSCFKILQHQSAVKERTKQIPGTEMIFPRGYMCAQGMSANCPFSSPCVQANLAEKSSGIQWTCKPEGQDEQCLVSLPHWDLGRLLLHWWRMTEMCIHSSKSQLWKISQVSVSELLIKLRVDCKTKNEANTLHNLLDCCCVCMCVFIDSSSSIVNWINHGKRSTLCSYSWCHSRDVLDVLGWI